MPQTTETVTLKLPSGEEVDVVVPQGMSDQEIHSLMQMKHPEMITPSGPARPEVHGLDDAPTAPPDQSFLQKAATQPSTFSHANPLRYLDELGQGMAGGTEAMLHPLDTAKKMYHSFTTDDNIPKDDNKPFLQGLGDVADQVAQGWGQAAVAAPIAKATGRVISELTPSAPQLGSPENPGPMSKLPTRVPASVLKAEAAATEPTPPTPVRAKPGIARLLNRSSGPTEFGGGGKGGSVWNRPSPRNSAVESQSGLQDLGSPRPRARMGPPLRPNVFASPEEAQIYDNHMSRLGAEAKDAGMYSAARGKVGRVPDYQERTGAAMSPFGGGSPPPSELSPPSTIRPYAPDPGTRTPDFDLVQQAASRMKTERAAGTIPEGVSDSARAQQILDELKKAK